MNNDGVAISAYQDKAAGQSTFNANRLQRWAAATTKGPIDPISTTNLPSRDTCVIGAIVIGGILWYVFRRSKVVKTVESAV